MEEKEELKLQATGSNHQCPNCAGNLVYWPLSQKLHCVNCGSEFDIPKNCIQEKKPLAEGIENNATNDEWAKNAKVCRCTTCGAQLVVEGLNITEKCPYCGADYVLDETSIPGLKPDTVVPFAFNEEEAAVRFVKGAKKLFFIPNSFRKKLPANKVRGIYVPSFAFDAGTSSKYRGVLVKEHKHTDSKGNTHTTYEHINISGTKQLAFQNVTIESSSKMKNKEMKALLPYDLTTNYEYQNDFIRGYSSEHYEDDLETCYKVAQQEMEAQIKARILDEARQRYHYDRVQSFSMTTDFTEEKYQYRLLPVYCFEFTYKKKAYLTFMNGQTGKVGTGYPKSALKIALLVLGIIAIIALILVLFIFFGGN